MNNALQRVQGSLHRGGIFLYQQDPVVLLVISKRPAHPVCDATAWWCQQPEIDSVFKRQSFVFIGFNNLQIIQTCSQRTEQEELAPRQHGDPSAKELITI